MQLIPSCFMQSHKMPLFKLTPTFFNVKSDEDVRTTLSYCANLQHTQNPALNKVPVKCAQKHFHMTFVIKSHKSFV